MGAREALSWIKKKGWQRVIVETDAQVVINAVQGRKIITPFRAIIDDIRSLLHNLPMVQFRFVKCTSNMLAHTLAKQAFCNARDGRHEFFYFLPRFISNVVLSELFQ